MCPEQKSGWHSQSAPSRLWPLLCPWLPSSCSILWEAQRGARHRVAMIAQRYLPPFTSDIEKIKQGGLVVPFPGGEESFSFREHGCNLISAGCLSDFWSDVPYSPQKFVCQLLFYLSKFCHSLPHKYLKHISFTLKLLLFLPIHLAQKHRNEGYSSGPRNASVGMVFDTYKLRFCIYFLFHSTC